MLFSKFFSLPCEVEHDVFYVSFYPEMYEELMMHCIDFLYCSFVCSQINKLKYIHIKTHSTSQRNKITAKGGILAL